MRDPAEDEVHCLEATGSSCRRFQKATGAIASRDDNSPLSWPDRRRTRAELGEQTSPGTRLRPRGTQRCSKRLACRDPTPSQCPGKPMDRRPSPRRQRQASLFRTHDPGAGTLLSGRPNVEMCESLETGEATASVRPSWSSHHACRSCVRSRQQVVVGNKHANAASRADWGAVPPAHFSGLDDASGIGDLMI